MRSALSELLKVEWEFMVAVAKIHHDLENI